MARYIEECSGNVNGTSVSRSVDEDRPGFASSSRHRHSSDQTSLRWMSYQPREGIRRMLRRIVLVRRRGVPAFTGFVEGCRSIASICRHHQHDVYRFDMPMHEAFPVKVGKDVQTESSSRGLRQV